jgi:hypothetical protein
MKKNILLLLIILTSGTLSAQSGKKSILTKRTDRTESFQSVKAVFKSFKKGNKNSSLQLFQNRALRPKMSVDLLDGKGIHLITTYKMGPIPAFSLGARFNASIIITI